MGRTRHAVAIALGLGIAIHAAGNPPSSPPREAAAPPAAAAAWLPEIQRALAAKEYEASASGAALQAPNRKHGLRTWFEPAGARVHDRTAAGSPALVALRLRGLGRGSALAAVPEGEVASQGARVEIRRPGLVEWYVNSEAGLEQGFTLAERPAGTGPLVLELALAPARARLAGERVLLETDAGRTLAYGKLAALDARGAALLARFDVPSPERLRIALDDSEAVYPLTIDPLLTQAADTQLEADQANARLGLSVATAGDVNGDGYADVIVGADYYDAGQLEEGAAFIFLGSASGIASAGAGAAATRLEGDALGAGLGFCVAGAGDVNGDGYDDVIVGAPTYTAGETEEGAAFVFLGSASGVVSAGAGAAAAQLESDQADAQFGFSVAGAGDVNGDGYADVIVGAEEYDSGESGEGAAFVFLGGASGVADGNPTTANAKIESDQADASLGTSVASAGDVNGDGRADVIAGARFYDAGHSDEGAAWVFLGNASGITGGGPGAAAAQLESNQASTSFGISVAGAGDVNGDGYADVIVGAKGYAAGVSLEGAAFVFHGGASGIASGNPSTADGQLESDQASALLGQSVAGAGDVNGDGYADVLAGAPDYDGGEDNEGAVFVWLGGPTGIANGHAAAAFAKLESDQADASLGYDAAGAGDVNGDGYADVIGGAYFYDAGESDEGAAFVYLGGARGIVDGSPATAAAQLESNQADALMGWSVAGAGDVNADGYADVIVGATYYDAGQTDEGAAFVFLGGATGIADGSPATAAAQLESDQANAQMGTSVAGAGDVNGDGYADVIVGAPYYDAGQTDEGAAFVFLGSAAGIADGSPATAASQLESDQTALMGTLVAGAGDVNGDGYADVIVGASYYSAGESIEGAAFVFLGSATGIADGNPATAAAQLESDQANAQMGTSVAGAGDVNGDGYADVIVGAPYYDAGQTDEGAAFVFLGSAAGIADGNPATAAAQLESDQEYALMGWSVAGAGDVNADGYADVIVGATYYDAGQTDEGAAFVFLGSATSIADGSPATAAAQLESDQAIPLMGTSVAGAGDVNADGYADVIVGAPYYDAGQTDEGAAFVFLGGAAGIADGSPATAAAQLESNQVDAALGVRVAGAGDVNGDGYADVIVGAHGYDAGQTVEGAAFVFLGGGNQTGRPVLARQLRVGSSTLVSPWGASNATQSFDVRMVATHPQGRGMVKLQVEACPASVAFGLGGCTTQTQAAWTPIALPAASATLTFNVGSLPSGTLYHWRARVLRAQPSPGIDVPSPAHGPWRRLHAQAVEADIRTSVDTDGDGILDAIDLDDDNDGLLDAFELANGFDPLDPDEDSDNRIDGQDDFDGDGLGNAAEYLAGTNPNVVDTDGDGLLDGQEIGTGVFGAQLVISTTADGAVSVFAADVDGDDDMDVLSASQLDNKISWYENDGTPSPGTWTEHVISTSAAVLYSVFAADVDGDGDTDVLSASYLDYKIAWYENDGTPSVGAWTEHAVSTSAAGAHSVFAADVDGDADTDVLSASWIDNEIAWYENDGTPSVGSWAEHPISTAATGAASVFAADVDGDGDTDVLSASYNDDKIAWYENDGTPSVGSWAEHSIATADDGAASVVAADVDGDGDTDVLSGSVGDNKIAWYENDGTPSSGAWSEHVISTAADSYSVFGADVDGDGDTDVLSVSYDDDKIAWYENDGTPSLGAWSEHAISTIADGAYSVFAADMDGDGDTDVLSASFLDDTIAWYGQQNVADPLDPDSDDDGLQDAPEVALGTDPLDEDTDDDLVCDGSAQTGACTASGPDNCPFVGNFAQTNGDAFAAGDACQCGDVTGDGPLTAVDYERAREHVVGRTLGGPFDADRCDVNGDSACDVEDLAVLARALGGVGALVDACEAYTGP